MGLDKNDESVAPSGFHCIEDLTAHLRGLPLYERVRTNSNPDGKGFRLLIRKIRVAHPKGSKYKKILKIFLLIK